MSEISRITWLLSTLLLTACASQVPVNIREEPPENPLLDQVRDNAADFESRQVRWGGEILAIDNRENATVLSVLARPLNKDGEPSSTDSSQGRFLAEIPAFIDPMEYTTGRNVTVRGTLAGTETRQVGEYPYTYPVVKATDWYLWPEEVQYSPDYYYPWWFYDPWFYGPWYGYPYYPYSPYYPHYLHQKGK